MASAIEQRLEKRWAELWGSPHTGMYHAAFGYLITRYSEPHRKYHTLVHLDQVLRELDPFESRIDDPLAVELALWFHDAIYETRPTPGAPSSEEQSAQYVEDVFIRWLDLDCHYARLVATYVRETAHKEFIVTGEAVWVLDADLSILGKDEATFDEYERQVREEYSWVPTEIFNEKRSEILKRLMNRSKFPTIYRTGEFRDLYEDQARRNLTRSIELLRS